MRDDLVKDMGEKYATGNVRSAMHTKMGGGIRERNRCNVEQKQGGVREEYGRGSKGEEPGTGISERDMVEGVGENGERIWELWKNGKLLK